jgi:hypothetical protein
MTLPTTYARRASVLPAALGIMALLSAACGADRPTPSLEQPCDSDNGRLSLPDGFCATVFADNQVQRAAVAAYVWSLSHV